MTEKSGLYSHADLLAAEEKGDPHFAIMASRATFGQAIDPIDNIIFYPNHPEGEVFLGGQDLLDNLRLEMSSLTPTDENRLRDFAQIANDEIVEMFGQYIPQDLLDGKPPFEKRVIFVDKDSLKSFLEAWSFGMPESQALDSKSGSPMASTWHFLGEIVTLEDPIRIFRCFPSNRFL
jgi:hypothetical protein